MEEKKELLQTIGSAELPETANGRSTENTRSITRIATGSWLCQGEKSYDPAEEIIMSYEKLMTDCMESMKQKLWIECKNVYYVPVYELLVEKADHYRNIGFSRDLLGYKTVCFTLEQARYLFFIKKELLPDSLLTALGNSSRFIGSIVISCDNNDRAVGMMNGVIYNWSSDDGAKIRIASAHVPLEAFVQKVITDAFQLRTTDEKVVSLRSVYIKLKERGLPEVIPPLTDAEHVKLYRALRAEPDVMKDLSSKLPVEKTGKNIRSTGPKMDRIIEKVCNADQERAELKPDDRRCVEDINRGHWELWNADSAGGDEIPLDRELVARNPVADIRRNGVIGIDFGTRSTIVSCQGLTKEHPTQTTLLRVGRGQLSEKPEPFHFENPTILEFCDFESFLKKYHAERGRPHTSFRDLYVSHTAANDLKNSSDSGQFYSFFYDIKQWCGSPERYQRYKIIDQKNQIRVLPTYLEVDSSFDPVEIYAYYLGLFINNMRNGIYLNYILSFPAMYPKAVREKMLESFRSGLKKSLPQAVLDDQSAMKDFRVDSGVSEPEAYAITALQSYGFAPEGDEKIFYGIFDFGGGTTDYDFGVWREADQDKREEEGYDYVITHLESGGDKYLGGENLLERLAFEVFRANVDALRPSEESAGYSFCIPAGVAKPVGMETLISDSQEARRNTKALMEALRPFWEGLTAVSTDLDSLSDSPHILHSTMTEDSYQLDPAGKGFKIVNEGCVEVAQLFDNNGNPKPTKLIIGSQDDNCKDSQDDNCQVNLLGILEKEIDRGVRNFFEALRPLADDRTTGMMDARQMQIFIAGNSGKSPILASLFRKYIAEYTKKMKERGETDLESFVIFPPLGTPEAIAIQKERGVEDDTKEYDPLPTGKTGVAYGLIAGRSGGTIKVITEQSKDKETKFKYYLGIARKGKFRCLTNRNTPYHTWVRFGNAGSETFELYYSTLPESTSNKMAITLVSKVRLQLDTVNIEADLFIRTVTPTGIEYVVAFKGEDGEVREENYLCQPKRVDLT